MKRAAFTLVELLVTILMARSPISNVMHVYNAGPICRRSPIDENAFSTYRPFST